MGGARRAMPVTQNQGPARTAAEQIWSRAIGDAEASADVDATAHQLGAGLRIGLVRWLGSEGYRALMARALGEAGADHAVLAGLTRIGEDQPATRAAVRTHGADALAAGMVALLTAMIDVLGTIMGDVMAVHLVEQNCVPRARSAGRQAREEERDG